MGRKEKQKPYLSRDFDLIGAMNAYGLVNADGPLSIIIRTPRDTYEFKINLKHLASRQLSPSSSLSQCVSCRVPSNTML